MIEQLGNESAADDADGERWGCLRSTIVNGVVGKLSGGQKCQQVTIKSSNGNRIRTNVHAACVTETAVSPFFATPAIKGNV